MFKQFLAGVLGLLFISLSFAATTNTGIFERQLPLTDTTDQEDSLGDDGLVLNDTKKEFREFRFSEATNLPLGIDAEDLNPQAVSFVEDYVQKNGDRVARLKDWGQPFLNLMDGILEKYNLPRELKYLAVIESYLKTNARSWAGAVGPWQFMPQTARNMGLRVGRKYDERRDFTKSTHAASKYLTSLYSMYNDWLLVIAAYNGGPGKVDAAIRKSGSRDFWTLQRFLPAESRNHVKKFIATHYIMEGQGGLTTTGAQGAPAKATVSEADQAASKTETISGRYNSFVIMKHISMDIASFNRLNPNFDRSIGSNGTYELRLPYHKMELFLAKKPVILDESMQVLLGTN